MWTGFNGPSFALKTNDLATFGDSGGDRRLRFLNTEFLETAADLQFCKCDLVPNGENL
jgi:hypothetical protein